MEGDCPGSRLPCPRLVTAELSLITDSRRRQAGKATVSHSHPHPASSGDSLKLQQCHWHSSAELDGGCGGG